MTNKPEFLSALADGDALVHPPLWGSQVYDVVGGQKVPIQISSDYKMLVHKSLEKIKLRCGVDTIDACFAHADSHNYRFDLTEELHGFRYKDNRGMSFPPIGSGLVYSYVKENTNLLQHVVEGETDDAVALEWKDRWDGPHCLVHVDKDLNMLPGWHYAPGKDEFYYVSPVDGERDFITQCLMGDRADNIPGLKGIGPKKAAKLVEQWNPSDMPSAEFIVTKYEELSDKIPPSLCGVPPAALAHIIMRLINLGDWYELP